jgi:hypothetical protein
MPKLTVQMPDDPVRPSRPALVLPEVVADGDQVFRSTPFEFAQTKAMHHGLIPVSQPTVVLKAENVGQTIRIRSIVGER